MALSFKNQIVGLIRFSYPAKGGFAKSFDRVKDAKAFLYDPVRLERRFHLFEKMCLPALKRQTDPVFTLVVLVGQDLPDAAKDRLRSQIQPLQDAHLVALPSKHHYHAMRAGFDTVSPGHATHRTSFRLDDDDALSRDYIAQLKRRAAQCHDLADGEPVALAFNRGFYVERSEAGNAVYDAVERTPLSVGSALVTPIGHADNIYARNHRFLPQFFDTFSDATTPNWIRTIHSDNDSEPHINGLSKQWDVSQIEEVLKQRFAQSFADLKAL